MKVSQSVFSTSNKEDWIFSDITFESMRHFEVYVEMFLQTGWKMSMVSHDKWERTMTLTTEGDKWIQLTYPLQNGQ